MSSNPTIPAEFEQFEARFYQDFWFKGRTLRKGRRECCFRYEVLREWFSQFKRPIKVLDIGANLGYFSLRLAEEFPGNYTLIESSGVEATILHWLCQQNEFKGQLLTANMNVNKVLSLSRQEPFDVVIGMSVIHHFADPYPQVLDALTQLGRYLIVEVPRPEEGLFQKERVSKEHLDFSRYRSQILTRPFYILMQDPTTSKERPILRDLYVIDCGQKMIATGDSSGKSQIFLTDIDFEKNRLYDPTTSNFYNTPLGLSLNTLLSYQGISPNASMIKSQFDELHQEYGSKMAYAFVHNHEVGLPDWVVDPKPAVAVPSPA